MTTTAAKMIGHTLTVERIVDVPELVGTVLYRQAVTNAFGGPVLAFIERRDGAFVACHGTNDQRDDLHPYNDHWTNCRLLAENMAGLAGPYEDLHYVSLTVGETLPADVTPAKQTPTTPTEIAAQMATLADQLRESLIDNDEWDCDWAAITASAKATTENLTGVASLVLDFADNSDDPAWADGVYDAAEKAVTQLVNALTAVDALADEVANAQSVPTAEGATVTVQLSGLIFAWMADQDLDQVTSGMSRGEVEWRTALRTATSRQIGRGVAYSLVVSHDAAHELAGELGERAESERRTPPAERVMSPWLLDKTVEQVRKLLPAELQAV